MKKINFSEHIGTGSTLPPSATVRLHEPFKSIGVLFAETKRNPNDTDDRHYISVTISQIADSPVSQTRLCRVPSSLKE